MTNRDRKPHNFSVNPNQSSLVSRSRYAVGTTKRREGMNDVKVTDGGQTSDTVNAKDRLVLAVVKRLPMWLKVRIVRRHLPEVAEYLRERGLPQAQVVRDERGRVIALAVDNQTAKRAELGEFEEDAT